MKAKKTFWQWCEDNGRASWGMTRTEFNRNAADYQAHRDPSVDGCSRACPGRGHFAEPGDCVDDDCDNHNHTTKRGDTMNDLSLLDYAILINEINKANNALTVAHLSGAPRGVVLNLKASVTALCLERHRRSQTDN